MIRSSRRNWPCTAAAGVGLGAALLMWPAVSAASLDSGTSASTARHAAARPSGAAPNRAHIPRGALILSAFPAEADAILARTTLDPAPSVVVDGKHFYLGDMGGRKVIVAMTGIDMANATTTTTTALEHFAAASGTTIGAVVFSGVAGGFGQADIGSVVVPARWSSDSGAT